MFGLNVQNYFVLLKTVFWYVWLITKMKEIAIKAAHWFILFILKNASPNGMKIESVVIPPQPSVIH